MRAITLAGACRSNRSRTTGHTDPIPPNALLIHQGWERLEHPERGFSAYVGDGQSPWSAVHRLDAARLFRLALERAARNEAFHAVAESVPFRLLAEAISRQVGVPVKSLTPEEAETHFGGLAIWVVGSGPVSSERTKAVLGWEPRRTGFISDIDRPEYYG